MSIITNEKKIEELLTRGVEEIIDREALKKALLSGRQLRIKLGIDPTSPNLHLGRSVPLLKLRDFQELGHKIVFIVGDFTGVIGDTSDKDSERPMLDAAVVKKNLRTYKQQAGKILDIAKTEIYFNSKGLGKLRYQEIAEHANIFSLSEFIARENIRRRLDEGKRVSLRELLYPLMQGYDSVAVKADVEVGGTDQRFNLLAGRKMQEHFGMVPQDIVMNSLVEGTDGRKMSSSWGNTINFTDSPDEMFGKIMSIRDELIVKYFEYFTRVPIKEIEECKKAIAGGANPRDYKAKLARAIVAMYHSEKDAETASAEFDRVHKEKLLPEEIAEYALSAPTNIVDMLVASGLCVSKSDARRAIDGGGVRVGGKIVEDYGIIVNPDKEGIVVQKGKRGFVKVVKM
ncbi:TPA: tyrosine--tRNA ligase [Candidatus Uhrbacteria bacterium]|nr:tyrosine--tRNA ligase [Candidatus Uhrbacteria bacterium]